MIPKPQISELPNMTRPGSLTQLLAGRTLPALSLLFVASALAASTARAETPVLLWGFHSGCEALATESQGVEKTLYAQKQDVGLLRTPDGRPLPACSGEHCAQVLRSACASASGRILGGQVVASRTIVRARLWLHDLASGQTAYLDDYCESCDLGIANMLSAQARRLIDQPHFGSPPELTPSYCSAAAARSDGLLADGKAGPLFLTVYGDGKHRAPLHEALKQQLGLRGRQVLPVPLVSTTYARDELERIVSEKQDAQVLGVNVARDGKVQMFLYDQRSAKTHFKSLGCPECAQDKEMLVARVQPELAALLEHCFTLQCADPGTRPAGTQPPPEACEAFPEPQCGGEKAPASASLPSRYIDPTTAKIVKGSLWGLFAASGVSAIALFAASGTSAGTLQQGGLNEQYALDRPAWAMTAVSAVTLGLAIPITAVLSHAERTSHAAKATTPSSIECPR